MNAFAVRAEHLSKRYRIGVNRGAAGNRLGSPLSYLSSTLRAPTTGETLWALNDVSFEIGQGEAVAIVGRNGAGKSTLLKVLTRITEPTSGRAQIRGRVASLLEIGTGFHAELTGRENIFLSGAILGMKRAEIVQLFDEIVAFSEVERFLDTPVKRYSSGMYVRLAFSVAAHLQPEVLMVDEVLAVGDSSFQRKCLGKMGDVASEGRTVLFVSHNMIAVQNLCKRAIWLADGTLRDDGPVANVISNYLATSYTSSTDQVWPDKSTAPGNERVRIRRVSVRPENGLPGDPITMNTPLTIEAEYWNLTPGERLSVLLHVYNEQQMVVFTTASNETDPLTRDNPLEAGLIRSTCIIPGNFLNEGTHRVALFIVHNSHRTIHRMEDALVFNIIEIGQRTGFWYGREPGVVRPLLDWRSEYVASE